MIPFRITPSLIAIAISEHVSLSDERPLFEMFEIFAISQDIYQPLNFLRYLTLSTRYPKFLLYQLWLTPDDFTR